VYDPDMTIEEKLSLSRVYLMQKDQKRAQQVLEEAAVSNPNHPELTALHGVLCMMQGKYETAIEALEKAKALNPDLAMIYYNLAKSYRKCNRLEQAEEAARKALTMNAMNFDAHVELGCILFKTARAKEALDHLFEAIRLNPDFLKAYLILGQLCKTAGTGEDATSLYRNALQRLPDAHILREELCALYAAKEDFDSAYKEAAEIAARRNIASDYIRAGNYARLLGSADVAEAAFQKAKELNPEVARNL
jgi:protein O-GlcNAc transferase